MGCDIHAFAEKFDEGKWKQIKGRFKNTYSESYGDEVYTGRNYELFSLLADVRNGNGIVPIALPKGIPTDASHGYLAKVEQYGSDGHSHSYFTLEELKNISKKITGQTIHDKSLITDKDADGTIKETCQSTNGKHYGEVGKRKLFSVFKDEKSPIDEIIKSLEEEQDDKDDSKIRLVFFFDN